MDEAEVAKTMSGQGLQVTSPDELEVAIKAIQTRTGPIIVELKLDPNNLPRMRM